MSPSDFETRVAQLIRLVRKPAPQGVFNPWHDRDEDLDLPRAPKIRSDNLAHYLKAHRGAQAVLVGEAAGWAGCRFTGIPFTGENLLAGPEALEWTTGLPLRRSSTRETPYKERSATVVWGELAGDRRIVLWNAVPWHPHRPGEPLTNRKPTRSDQEAGRVILMKYLEIFENARPVAIGRVSQEVLRKMGIEAEYIRHPSMGGHHRFRQGVRQLQEDLTPA